MVGHVLEPLFQDGDLAADHPPVGFELRLARPAEPDTAPDARQVGPHPREARQEILELGELHLHLRFRRARPRGEDVQNHLGAVHHPHRQRLLEIGPLRGRQRLVEQHQSGPGLLKDALQLLHFALPEVQVGCGRLEPLVGPADDVCAGGVGQPAECSSTCAASGDPFLGAPTRNARSSGGWMSISWRM